MRSVLALSLLVALCASANAAPMHHFKRVHHAEPRHFILRPGQGVDPPFARPDARFPPVIEDQTPSYDDPSKFGGG
jgi:hypothetical protein